MTRKDYIAIAECIFAARPADGMPAQWQNGCESAREVIARKLADRIQLTNARFNRALFMTACGL